MLSLVGDRQTGVAVKGQMLQGRRDVEERIERVGAVVVRRGRLEGRRAGAGDFVGVAEAVAIAVSQARVQTELLLLAIAQAAEDGLTP